MSDTMTTEFGPIPFPPAAPWQDNPELDAFTLTVDLGKVSHTFRVPHVWERSMGATDYRRHVEGVIGEIENSARTHPGLGEGLRALLAPVDEPADDNQENDDEGSDAATQGTGDEQEAAGTEVGETDAVREGRFDEQEG